MTREHLRDVERNDKDASKPVAKYFNRPNHPKQHIAVCGLSLQLGSSESCEFSFEIGTLNPHGINERFSFNYFRLFFCVTIFPPIASLHFLPRYTHTHTHTHNFSILHPLCRRANARNVSFETLYNGQFTLSTQLIIPSISNRPSAKRKADLKFRA